MSLRQQNLGSIIKPGFNPLGAQTSSYVYNLFEWGSNNYGQLGLGNTTNYSSPMQVGSLTNWLALTASYVSTTAVKTDGTLWAWGRGQYGALGLSNTTNYSSPKQVGALTNWLQISGGYGCVGAVKTDGTLWTWGAASVYGALGHNNTVYYSSPKQVGSLSTWSSISFSTLYYAAAVKTDGTLWMWGYNAYGQLGNGTITNYSSPIQVGALTTWARVATGNGHVLATKTDGTLWAWGNGSNGQLGIGNTLDKRSPNQIGALTNWLYVATGYNQSFALKTDGTLWSWGNNTFGSLGLNNRTYYSSPKQVGALTTWSQVSACGFGYYCSAIRTDGTLWTWGLNSSGQLGHGNRTQYSSPKQVGSSTTWSKLNTGASFMMALG